VQLRGIKCIEGQTGLVRQARSEKFRRRDLQKATDERRAKTAAPLPKNRLAKPTRMSEESRAPVVNYSADLAFTSGPEISVVVRIRCLKKRPKICLFSYRLYANNAEKPGQVICAGWRNYPAESPTPQIQNQNR
jgi:hypothetical protein